MGERADAPRLVVGVGASAGGLDAFKSLLSVLPADGGMCFLLVQHLDPTHDSMLSELLVPHTGMQLREAQDGMRLTGNTVFVIPPNTSMAVKGGRIELTTPTLHRGVRLPVDHLFRSLAEEYGTGAAAVVLSGAGGDGSDGLRDLKGAGGLVIAQKPESSGQSGMPQSAIDTGVVDLVLDITAIPGALQRFVDLPEAARTTQPAKERGSHEPAVSLSQSQFRQLGSVLDAHANFDLRVYKMGTIERRVVRRVVLSGHQDVSEYLERLSEDPEERNALMRDLLINVTDFFRDTDAFSALQSLVLEPLVTHSEPGTTLRVWSAGCATGEEAYSLAIEILELCAEQGVRFTLQVFATDIDRDALAYARRGIYPVSIAQRISANRLNTYFSPVEGAGYQVRSFLRDAISFAVHDLTKDPPFSRMHLVSCRNVLIYLTAEAQKEVLNGLNFALQEGAHLFLSPSESTGQQRSLFSTISKRQSIFKKIASADIQALSPSRRGTISDPGTSKPKVDQVDRRSAPREDRARQAVLQRWAPPTVAVAEDGRVVFVHGDLTPYLKFPEGDTPRMQFEELVRPELATRTRGAIYTCRRDKETVVTHSSEEQALRPRVRITAHPAPSLGDAVVLVSFEQPAAGAPPDTSRPAAADDAAVVGQLERELAATREDLRNTVEELETSNEELRSANEESMSMNEELQSTNEELEATTEELRSLNEELTTVNSQLREKLAQLEQANDDLDNFFNSTQIATLFLDDRFRIKRFTPAAGELLAVKATHAGQPVSDVARDLLRDELEKDAQRVLDDFQPQIRRVKRHERVWERRTLPYRTQGRRISGVVVTWLEMTKIERALAELRESEARLALAKRAAGLGVHDYNVVTGELHWDRRVYEIWGYDPGSEITYDMFMEGIHPDDRAATEAAVDEALDPGGGGHLAVNYRVVNPKDGKTRWIHATGDASFKNGAATRVVGTVEDISDIVLAEEQLKESRSQLMLASRRKDEYLAMLGHELRNPLSAIRNACHLLQLHESGDADLTHARDILLRQTEHMGSLLDGLLDVSRIVLGKIPLRREPLDLTSLCREELDELSQRHHGVRVQLPAGELWVLGDATRMSQVVANLVGNAIKFTPETGSINVSLASQGAEAILTVSDTGIGIEDELSPHIFDIFRQSERKLDRAKGGLGIGLALVKKLVELHEGTVSVHSEGANEGATFVVTLPLLSDAARLAHENDEVGDVSGHRQMPPIRILVIEDNRDAATSLHALLESLGHEVEVATTGRRALAIAREFGPELILCDIGLPGELDGFDVALALRSDPEQRNVLLVALSGYGGVKDKQRSESAGFDAHLTKPMDFNKLRETLAELWTQGTGD